MFFMYCQVLVLIVLKISLSKQQAETLEHKKHDIFGKLGE